MPVNNDELISDEEVEIVTIVAEVDEQRLSPHELNGAVVPTPTPTATAAATVSADGHNNNSNNSSDNTNGAGNNSAVDERDGRVIYVSMDDYVDDDAEETADADEDRLRSLDPFCGSVYFQHSYPLLVEGLDIIDYQHFNNLFTGNDCNSREMLLALCGFREGLSRAPQVPLVDDADIGAVAIDFDAYQELLYNELHLKIHKGDDDSTDDGGFSYSPTVRKWSSLSEEATLSAREVCDMLLFARNIVLAKFQAKSFAEHDPPAASDGGGPCAAVSAPMYRRVLEEATCSLCMEVMVEPVTLRCGHSSCLECISRASQASSACPTCRVHYEDDFSVSITLRNLIESLFHDDPEYNQRKHAMRLKLAEENERVRQMLAYFRMRCRGQYEEFKVGGPEDWTRQVSGTYANSGINHLLPFNITATTSAPSAPGEDDRDAAYAELIPDQVMLNIMRQAGTFETFGVIINTLRDPLIDQTKLFLTRAISFCLARHSEVLTSRDMLRSLSGGGVRYYGCGVLGYKGLWTRTILNKAREVGGDDFGISSSAFAVLNDVVTDLLLQLTRRARTLVTEPTLLSVDPSQFPTGYTGLVPFTRTTQSGAMATLVRDLKEVNIPPHAPSDLASIAGMAIVGRYQTESAIGGIFSGEIHSKIVAEATGVLNEVFTEKAAKDPASTLEMACEDMVSPERLAVLVAKELRTVFTESAVVYIVAVADCLLARVLELAIADMKESHSHFLEAHHVANAIRGDAELRRLSALSEWGSYFSVICCFRGGRRVMSRSIKELEELRADHDQCEFVEMLYDKAEQMPYRVLVDPRDGYHYRATSAPGIFIPMRELDAACKLPAATRAKAARALLTARERRLLAEYSVCGREFYCYDRQVTKDAYNVEALPLDLFYRLCRKLAAESGNASGEKLRFTAEAMLILKDFIESLIVSKVCFMAVLLARRASGESIEDIEDDLCRVLHT